MCRRLDIWRLEDVETTAPGSRLQPLRGDPDNPPPEGTNTIAQARTPQARPSGPAREKYFQCRFFRLGGMPFRQSSPSSSYLPDT